MVLVDTLSQYLCAWQIMQVFQNHQAVSLLPHLERAQSTAARRASLLGPIDCLARHELRLRTSNVDWARQHECRKIAKHRWDHWVAVHVTYQNLDKTSSRQHSALQRAEAVLPSSMLYRQYSTCWRHQTLHLRCRCRTVHATCFASSGRGNPARGALHISNV